MRFAIHNDTRIIVGGVSVNAKSGETVIESDERLDRLNPFFSLIDDEQPKKKTVKRFSDISK